MYADKMTKSIQATIEATEYRRKKQIKYNEDHGQTPQPIVKSLVNALTKAKISPAEAKIKALAEEKKTIYWSKPELEKKIRETRQQMESSAKQLDFVSAAQWRDQLNHYQKQLEQL